MFKRGLKLKLTLKPVTETTESFLRVAGMSLDGIAMVAPAPFSGLIGAFGNTLGWAAAAVDETGPAGRKITADEWRLLLAKLTKSAVDLDLLDDSAVAELAELTSED